MRLTILFLLLFPILSWSNEIDKVNVYTDHAKDEISIQIEEQAHAVMVQIISDDGEVIWTEHHKEKEFKLDMRFFPNDTYTIKLSIYDKTESYLFIKK
ncbi:hypothetical protein K6119_13260 [Paracrocinitomix mangrovi]|uniref:hypothetical protein n=1 Tax=Paracrocinitomix mangrovi TaxID=2862509 RepID=UPI001C8DD71F|nr:hypothetical protein [Paracrocinitomix mangrovi]UKN00699.1 hypothetical protein K6119_13260 [Paracrocinitomix mangrovi]